MNGMEHLRNVTKETGYSTLLWWPKGLVCLGDDYERVAPDSLDFYRMCMYFLYETKAFNNIKIWWIECVCGVYHVQIRSQREVNTVIKHSRYCSLGTLGLQGQLTKCQKWN